MTAFPEAATGAAAADWPRAGRVATYAMVAADKMSTAPNAGAM